MSEFSSKVFKVDDYADETEGTWHWWRGYLFRVTDTIVVNALNNSVSLDNFIVGLYKADFRTPTELLGWGDCPTGRQRLVSIDPVTLEPGQDYIIATGRRHSGNQSYNWDYWNVANMVSQEQILDYWYPVDEADDPYLCLSWRTAGDEEVILNEEAHDTLTGRADARPDLGFEYYPETISKINLYSMLSNLWTPMTKAWTMVDGSWRLVSELESPDSDDILPVTCSAIDGASSSGRMWVGHDYYTALYKCEGKTPTELLGYVRVPNDTRRGYVTLSENIVLEEGEDYILAIGSSNCAQSHYNYAHYVIEPIDVTCMNDKSNIINWKPENGYAIRWNGQGGPDYIVGSSPDYESSSATIPDIGLRYTVASLGGGISPRVDSEWKGVQ